MEEKIQENELQVSDSNKNKKNTKPNVLQLKTWLSKTFQVSLFQTKD